MTTPSSAPAWARHWYATALAVSVFCILVTLFAGQLAGHGVLLHQLRTFGLAGENSVGAWWSGTLLLLVSVHAFDGALRHRDSPRIASAWFVLGGLMALLSLDEVGSVHERLAGGMVAMAALCAGGGLFVIGALFFHGQRKRAIQIAVAFGVLALALVQDELVGHLAIWRHRETLRQALEEGTELAGMLLLLRACMRNSFDSEPGMHGGHDTPIPFQAVTNAILPIMTAGVIVGPLFAYFSVTLPDHARGHTAPWLASAALFVAALLVLPNPARSEPQRTDRTRVVLALACMVCSALVVWINAYAYPFFNKLMFSGFCVCVLFLWHLESLKERRQANRWLLVSLVVSLMWMAWAAQSLTVTFWAESTIAMLVLFGHAAIARQRSADVSLLPAEVMQKTPSGPGL